MKKTGNSTCVSNVDIYLGDTSSQAIEFLMRPRPCVYLNALQADWREDSSYEMWRTGEVIEDLALLLPALDRAFDRHPAFEPTQAEIVCRYLGDTSGKAPERAAREVLAALDR